MTQDASAPAGKKRSLGRGLSALLSTQPLADETAALNLVSIALETIIPKNGQPRQYFDEAALEELTDSIRQHGVLQPILVRQSYNNTYEIIAGERRWRAAKRAGLQVIPAIIRENNQRDDIEIALIENLQRQDLNPIEEAACYQRLISDIGYSQDDVAIKLARSRSHVTNYLRLLQLPASVQAMVMDRSLSVGHARALVNAIDPELLAKKVIAKGLSVRQLEALLNKPDEKPRTTEAVPEIDEGLTATAAYLSEFLRLPVSAYRRRNGAAQLRINIATQDDLAKLQQIWQH